MSMQTNSKAWAQELFGQCRLCDARLTRRLVHTMAVLARHGGGSISAACHSDAAALQGGYRLLRNRRMSVKAMSEAGFAATAARLDPHRTVLAIEDTTELSYCHGVTEELGDTGGPRQASAAAIWSHNTLLVDAHDGTTLGLIAQTLWCRQPPRGKKHAYRRKPIEEKESSKWSRHAAQMRDRLGERMRQVITVSDRESDVFAYLQDKHAHGERFIVRAAQDRTLQDGDERLFETLLRSARRGRMSVRLAQRGGRPARTACVSLHAQSVVLSVSRGEMAPDDECIPLNAILAWEEKADVPGRLCWVLLTSEPVHTAEQIEQVMRWYAMRWRVEEFHKAWKSGARVEALRQQSRAPLERMAVMLAFVAVRLLQLRETLEDAQRAERPCTEVLSDQEWKILWIDTHGNRPLPAKPPTLRQAYEAVARLGGFYDSRHTGRAGWAAMYEGWTRLQDHVELARALGKTL